MIQYYMLTAEQIKVFFTRHDIPLQGKKNLLDKTCQVVADALEFGGQVFMSFVARTIINSDINGVETYFSSYADAEECYTQYLMGYFKQKTVS